MRSRFVRYFHAIVGAAILISGTGDLLAQDDATRKRDHDHARIRTLIRMLASKNGAPRGSGDGVLTVGREYSKDAQAVVYLAIQQLLSERDAAFDLLVEHLNDEEYSYSYNAPTGYFNVAVGSVCQQIMTRVVECYDFEIEYITIDQRRLYMKHTSSEELKLWWKENRRRPLWKIQVEALDHAIEFMENVSRDTARSVHPNAERMPIAEFEKRRKQNLDKLKARRALIETSQEAYSPRSLESDFGTMAYLPWGNARPVVFSK